MTAEALAPSPAPTPAPLLSLRNIHKSFGAVHVLRGVDLDVRAGQVTALVGDNGAGKSTLIKGVAGIHAFDEGEYIFEGQPVTCTAPRTPTPSASRSSTRTSRCATTSTSSRTCSSAARWAPSAALDEDAMEAKAPRDPRRPLGAHAPVGAAPRSPRCPAASGRPSRSPARCCGTPSSSSSTSPPPPWASRRPSRCSTGPAARRQGLGVILISHNLNDVFEVADDIAVLYLGAMVAQVDAKDVTSNQVVELITTGRYGDMGLSAQDAAQVEEDQ